MATPGLAILDAYSAIAASALNRFLRVCVGWSALQCHLEIFHQQHQLKVPNGRFLEAKPFVEILRLLIDRMDKHSARADLRCRVMSTLKRILQ